MRSFLTIAGCVAALVIAPAAVAQQPTMVTGKVLDENDQPVSAASITFYDADNDTTYDTESNDKGEYVIAVRRGIYTVTVEKEGYRGAQSPYRINQRERMDLPTVVIISAKKILADALKDINAKFEKAAELAGAGKLDEAEAIYLKLEEEHPEVAEVHYNMGLLLARKDELDRAAASLEKALELRPDHAPAALALSGIYGDTGRGEEAAAMMEKVVTEYPDDADIRVAAGYFYLNANRREEARPHLEAALKLDPDNTDAHYLMATIAAGEGDIDEAVRLLERYLELAPPDDKHREAAETFLPELKGHVTSGEEGSAEPEL
jgi:tetratricopeptide (TPR) repeat protein